MQADKSEMDSPRFEVTVSTFSPILIAVLRKAANQLVGSQTVRSHILKSEPFPVFPRITDTPSTPSEFTKWHQLVSRISEFRRSSGPLNPFSPPSPDAHVLRSGILIAAPAERDCIEFPECFWPRHRPLYPGTRNKTLWLHRCKLINTPSHRLRTLARTSTEIGTQITF